MANVQIIPYYVHASSIYLTYIYGLLIVARYDGNKLLYCQLNNENKI